jgi:hypothetical protein
MEPPRISRPRSLRENVEPPGISRPQSLWGKTRSLRTCMLKNCVWALRVLMLRSVFCINFLASQGSFLSTLVTSWHGYFGLKTRFLIIGVEFLFRACLWCPAVFLGSIHPLVESWTSRYFVRAFGGDIEIVANYF